MSDATPRVGAAHLEHFQNKTVRIVGKVVQVRGESATVDAGGHINVHLNRDTHLAVGHAFEIVGKVTPDLSIRALASTDFGTNLDMTASEAVVNATHSFPEIFYQKYD